MVFKLYFFIFSNTKRERRRAWGCVPETLVDTAQSNKYLSDEWLSEAKNMSTC